MEHYFRNLIIYKISGVHFFMLIITFLPKALGLQLTDIKKEKTS